MSSYLEAFLEQLTSHASINLSQQIYHYCSGIGIYPQYNITNVMETRRSWKSPRADGKRKEAHKGKPGAVNNLAQKTKQCFTKGGNYGNQKLITKEQSTLTE
uniref:Uncharacterized protein n=1 Tax=Trichuris muris TaxID=70415 RepID=A0A5S6Q327_TRIMR